MRLRNELNVATQHQLRALHESLTALIQNDSKVVIEITPRISSFIYS